jgi:hypothetical protein
MPGFFGSIIADIGHADMAAAPDYIGHIWRDKRLVREKIKNNRRFLIAAIRLLEEYLLFLVPDHEKKIIILQETKEELRAAFGKSTRCILLNLFYYQPKRLKSYQSLSILHNELDIHHYSKTDWIDEALRKYQVNSYQWRNIELYQLSDWYLFQDAAVKHREFVLPLIKDKLDCRRA